MSTASDSASAPRSHPIQQAAELVNFGVLGTFVPREVIDQNIIEQGLQTKRSDTRMPAHVMMYFAMMMVLRAGDDYEQVMADLTEKLTTLDAWSPRWQVPTSGGITKARARLGSEVVRGVFTDLAHQRLADLLTPRAYLRQWLLMGIDGMTFDVPDTPANVEAFGRPGSSGTRRSAYPQARVLTLVECATRGPRGAAIGPVRGKATSERALAHDLVTDLSEDMLVICDRGFYGFDLWCRYADCGAQLLWRMPAGPRLPVLRVLSDGSYLSLVCAPSTRKAERDRLAQRAQQGQKVDPARARLVRVVEYEVPGAGTDGGPSDLFCLITTVLDPQQATADELAWAYGQRWEHEEANKIIKQTMRGPGRVLRSRTPAMVLQELYAYLLVNYAFTALMARAASEASIDPAEIKPTRTWTILRRRVSDTAAFPP